MPKQSQVRKAKLIWHLGKMYSGIDLLLAEFER